MKFVIDRSKWRCGGSSLKTQRGLGITSLLNEDGYMCCLGHICSQLGVTSEQMLGCDYPAQTKLGENIPPELEFLIELEKVGQYRRKRNSEFAKKAVEINDTIRVSDEIREERLQELAKQFDHEIEFVGDYCALQAPSR